MESLGMAPSAKHFGGANVPVGIESFPM